MGNGDAEDCQNAARISHLQVYGIHHLLLEGFDFNLLQVQEDPDDCINSTLQS